MTITNLFFVFALSISLLFVITFIVLFIQYTIIYERVSHNFKAVEHGWSIFNDFYASIDLDFFNLGSSYPSFWCSFLAKA